MSRKNFYSKSLNGVPRRVNRKSRTLWEAHMGIRLVATILVVSVLGLSAASADVGDPQLKTDHPWYPGELSCSTFERLFRTQADLYQRVTGRPVETDEDKVLAAWLWRNTHYWHGEEGAEDLWGEGFRKGLDLRTREYWT